MFYCRSEFTAPWALALPPLRGYLMLHLVTSGHCRLEIDRSAPKLLQQGDLILVPHGEGHQLSSQAGLKGEKLFDIAREQVSERYETLRIGGGGEPATMICGAFQFDHPAAHHLVTLLPQVILLPASSSDLIHSTLRVMDAEARELRPGGDTVITRLADVLVIHAIRSWIAQDPAAQTG